MFYLSIYLQFICDLPGAADGLHVHFHHIQVSNPKRKIAWFFEVLRMYVYTTVKYASLSNCNLVNICVNIVLLGCTVLYNPPFYKLL
jgi:hypothetical protein